MIKACLDAVDRHTELLLQTGESHHAEQADLLRQYVRNLKTWIHETENEGN
jgi:hypothetical protein